MKKLFEIGLLISMILIAVAATTPDFFEAQIRQRTARAHANLAAVGAALETYQVDYGVYPQDGAQYSWSYPNTIYWHLPPELTTPVAYVDPEFKDDPFGEDRDSLPPQFMNIRYKYIDMTWGTVGTRTSPSIYYSFLHDWYGAWCLTSIGPDETYGPYYATNEYPGSEYPQLSIPYDPTNGLDSDGDIILARRKMVDQP